MSTTMVLSTTTTLPTLMAFPSDSKQFIPVSSSKFFDKPKAAPIVPFWKEKVHLPTEEWVNTYLDATGRTLLAW